MRDDDRPDSAADLDWSEAERAALAELARGVAPPPRLEARVVSRLRAEALVGPPRPAAEPAWRAWIRSWSAPRLAWAAAAATFVAAVFLAGVAVGQRTALRVTADAFAAREDAVLAAAARVQRTGSDYVAALAALERSASSRAADVPPAELAQGREVAAAVLYAAAAQLVRLDPDDPLTARILQGLEGTQAAGETATAEEGGERRVVWF